MKWLKHETLTSATAGQEEEAKEEEAREEDGLEEVEALGLGLLGQHGHVHHLLRQRRQKVGVVGESVQAVPEKQNHEPNITPGGQAVSYLDT